MTAVRKLTYTEAKRWVESVEGEVNEGQERQGSGVEPDASSEYNSGVNPLQDNSIAESSRTPDSTAFPTQAQVNAVAVAIADNSPMHPGTWKSPMVQKQAQVALSVVAPVVSALRAERDEARAVADGELESTRENIAAAEAMLAESKRIQERLNRQIEADEAAHDRFVEDHNAEYNAAVAERDEARAEVARLREQITAAIEAAGESCQTMGGEHLPGFITWALKALGEEQERAEVAYSLLRGMARRASKLREEAQEAQWQHQGVVSYWRGSMETLRADLATAVSRADQAAADLKATQEWSRRHREQLVEALVGHPVLDPSCVDVVATAAEVRRLRDRAEGRVEELEEDKRQLRAALDHASRDVLSLTAAASRPSGFTLPDDAEDQIARRIWEHLNDMGNPVSGWDRLPDRERAEWRALAGDLVADIRSWGSVPATAELSAARNRIDELERKSSELLADLHHAEDKRDQYERDVHLAQTVIGELRAELQSARAVPATAPAEVCICGHDEDSHRECTQSTACARPDGCDCTMYRPLHFPSPAPVVPDGDPEERPNKWKPQRGDWVKHLKAPECRGTVTDLSGPPIQGAVAYVEWSRRSWVDVADLAPAPAPVQPGADEFGPHLAEMKQDPEFAAAYAKAEAEYDADDTDCSEACSEAHTYTKGCQLAVEADAECAANGCVTCEPAPPVAGKDEPDYPKRCPTHDVITDGVDWEGDNLDNARWTMVMYRCGCSLTPDALRDYDGNTSPPPVATEWKVGDRVEWNSATTGTVYYGTVWSLGDRGDYVAVQPDPGQGISEQPLDGFSSKLLRPIAAGTGEDSDGA